MVVAGFAPASYGKMGACRGSPEKGNPPARDDVGGVDVLDVPTDVLGAREVGAVGFDGLIPVVDRIHADVEVCCAGCLFYSAGFAAGSAEHIDNDGRWRGGHLDPSL